MFQKCIKLVQELGRYAASLQLEQPVQLSDNDMMLYTIVVGDDDDDNDEMTTHTK